MRADSFPAAVAHFDKLVGNLARGAAVCAGALLIVMVGHVILEIVLRTVFATSTFALDEFVGYGVAAVTFLSAGYAFQGDALIRVGIALDATRLHDGLRRAIELLGAFVAAAVVWFAVWYFARSVLRHLERGTVSETVAQVPLWIPEGLMLLGLAILALRISAYGLNIACGGALLDRQPGEKTDQGYAMPRAAAAESEGR